MVQRFFEEDYSLLQNREMEFLIGYRQNSGNRICSICQGGETPFEHVIFHCEACSGVIQGSMRYVIDPSFQYTWCFACYRTLPSHISIGNRVIEKVSLILRESQVNEKERVIMNEKDHS